MAKSLIIPFNPDSSSRNSSFLTPGVYFLQSDQDCCIKQGDSTVIATQENGILLGGEVEDLSTPGLWIEVRDVSTRYVAVIGYDSPGNLFISQLSEFAQPTPK